ncbi:MAG: beta-ketoacyl-ACP synthase II [Chloroflexota bacterium]
MCKRIVITGMGCISPLGNQVSILWENLLSGKSGIGPLTLFDASEHPCKIAAEVKDFDPSAWFGSREARRMDRFTQFGVAAAQLALRDSGLKVTDDNRDRVGAVIGSGIGGMGTLFEQMKVYMERGAARVSPLLVPMMLPDTAGGMLAIFEGMRGPNVSVSAACATGNYAIGTAASMIRNGEADVILAGGAEAVVTPIALAGMANMTALTLAYDDDPQRASRPFDLHRDGFVMGEGAAVLVLEALEHARARGANILAEVRGYGATNDAYHISAPAENGEGAVRCMQIALKDAGLNVNEIGYINAHGTSTQLNDKSETAAIKAVFGERAYQVPISSTKSMTGHLLGAAGALEAAICVQTLLTGVIAPTINYETPDPDCDLDYVPNQPRQLAVDHVLSNSFGFGGHNASLILSKFVPAEV